MVASTTERDLEGGDSADVGAANPEADVKTGAAGKQDNSGKKERNQVSNALRSVYQRAVEEDIPSEMLDLLRKLD